MVKGRLAKIFRITEFPTCSAFVSHEMRKELDDGRVILDESLDVSIHSWLFSELCHRSEISNCCSSV